VFLTLALLLTGPAAAIGYPVVHGVVQVIPPTSVKLEEVPIVAVAVPDRPSVVHLECSVTAPDGKERSFAMTSDLLPAGTPAQLSLAVAPPASSASCVLVANFANGLSEVRSVDLAWTWVDE